MSVTIKTADEIARMRVAGRLAAEVLEMIAPHVKAGITTDELDRICYDYIVNVQQAIPAPLNYHGFPQSICTSVNHVVCHGIPGDKRLDGGDILNIDVTVILDGWHGDTSRMFFVGKPDRKAERLCEITYSVVIAHTYDLKRIQEVAKGTAERLSTVKEKADQLESEVASRRRIGFGAVAFCGIGCLVTLRISSSVKKRSSSHDGE